MTQPDPTAIEVLRGYRVREVDDAVARLRNNRKFREVPQSKMAKQIGVTQSAISEWETGAVRPTAESLARWANALGFDLALIPRPIEESA